MKMVGSITTAVGLLALGLLLLVEQLYPGQSWAANPLQWWPLLLIGLGVELLFRRAIRKDTEMKIDPLILIFLVAVFGALLYGQVREVVLPSYVERTEYRQSLGASQMVEATLGQGEMTIGLFARQRSVTVR